MSGPVQTLTHGSAGLALEYVIVLAGLVGGLMHGRASWRQLAYSPLMAIPLILVMALMLAVVGPLLFAMGFEPGGVWHALAGLVISAAGSYLIGRVIASRPSSSETSYRRGAVVMRSRPEESSGRPAFAGRDTLQAAAGITLAGIAVAPEDETRHFKLIGTTGTGKSTAIQEILSVALARGDRAIIADPDGGYLRRYFDADRDVILNPFDGEGRRWNLFAEITNDYDVEQLARSFIPDSGGTERVWSEYARTFFIALVQQAINAGTRNDAELYRLLTSATLTELRVLLAGTAAAPFVEENNERMFGSIRSVASSAVRALKYTTRQQAVPFSVRQWVKEGAARAAGGRGGVLFCPYQAGEIAALASIISGWLRLAIFQAMDRDEGDQRLWFIIDELDALGAIDGLKDALARLRKFGGRCVLGFQSIAQVSGTYGRATADTIVENCGNTLILRCSGSEHGGTSEFASKLIGQRDVVHKTRSSTRRPGEWLAARSTGENLRTEPAVMASEIERLPALQGFLKLTSNPNWLGVTIRPDREAAKPRARQSAKITTCL